VSYVSVSTNNKSDIIISITVTIGHDINTRSARWSYSVADYNDNINGYTCGRYRQQNICDCIVEIIGSRQMQTKRFIMMHYTGTARLSKRAVKKTVTRRHMIIRVNMNAEHGSYY
jgi:hypothetical protein